MAVFSGIPALLLELFVPCSFGKITLSPVLLFDRIPASNAVLLVFAR